MGRTTLIVSLRSYFFTFWTVVQRKILQVNVLPKYFWNAKMQMWRLHRSLMIICTPSETEGLALVTILVHIFPAIWSFSYRSFVEILWKFMELLRIILFTDSAVSLLLSPPHCASWCWGWRNGLQTWRVAASILNKQSGQKSNGGFPALCLCQMLTKSHIKTHSVTKYFTMGWCGNFCIR